MSPRVILTGDEVARTVARKDDKLGVRIQNEGWFGVDRSPHRYDYASHRLVSARVLDPDRLRRTTSSDLNQRGNGHKICTNFRGGQIYRVPVRVCVGCVDVRRRAIRKC
jgi:hypothetical protein